MTQFGTWQPKIRGKLFYNWPQGACEEALRFTSAGQLGVEPYDVAIVGADTMLADGSTINKAGTSLLAMAAHAEKVPFYVCCESFKLCQQEEPPALEEMSPAELGTTQWPGVSVSNIYFDITPAHLITSWCTERGALDPGIGGK